jgi:predicted signal transduction protein with EAL and GGDEF domain
MGQAVGDEVLKQAASRLHDFAGQRHYVARLGGDEFVLLLPELNDRAAIEYAMSKLMAALARDYVCSGKAVSMSASVGIAVYTGSDISADSLLRHADQALYQAKITGRNRYHFFDADLDEQVRTHHNRRTEVRAAVHDNELVLYYQPKLDMRKGRIVGMEALLRWQHPLRGIIAPGDFLPIVEHSDVIVDIGEWVLRVRCGLGNQCEHRGTAFPASRFRRAPDHDPGRVPRCAAAYAGAGDTGIVGAQRYRPCAQYHAGLPGAGHQLCAG